MGRCMYVLIKTTHYPKYLNQFLTVLLETFTTGLVFARRLKQGAADLTQPIHPPMGGGVSTDVKSSNRTEISRFVLNLLNFY